MKRPSWWMILLLGGLLWQNLHAAIIEQQQLETQNLKITCPQVVEVWSGYREPLLFIVENKTSQPVAVSIEVITAINIFLNGTTCALGDETEPISITKFNLPAFESRTVQIEMQSLRVGDYTLKFLFPSISGSLVVSAQTKEKGAYFMHRCWFEGAEFFDIIMRSGSEVIDQRSKRGKLEEQVRTEMHGGTSREEAERIARRKIWEKYQSYVYEKRPNWETTLRRKKNERVDSYGFQFIDVDGLGWNHVERVKGIHDWSIGDFLLDLTNQNFTGEPFARIEVFPEWVEYERGSTGKWGFYDANNLPLLNRWENYCSALAERYDGDGINDAPGSPTIGHFILANEPEGSWFNVDFDREGWPILANEDEAPKWTSWYQAAFEQGGEETAGNAYVQRFGDLVFETTKRAAEGIHRANPKARVCTHQFMAMPQLNLYLFKYMLDKGIGDYVDAWGLHPGNAGYMLQLWQKNPQATWWLEDATNQAPPFEASNLTNVVGALDRRGQTLRLAQPREDLMRQYPYMGKLWRKIIDEPFSQNLEGLVRLFSHYGVDLPIWVTEELTIGPLATNRRENLIAALREYAIVFHLKVEITVLAGFITATTTSGNTPVGYLPDLTAKQLIIDLSKALAGSKPVEKFDCRWFMPEKDQYLDYSNVVYKLFNRGDEDIIALWSNSGKKENLAFDVDHTAQISNIRVTRFKADSEPFKSETNVSTLPARFPIEPLKEFYFISVQSDRPGFGWLKGIQRIMTSEEQELRTQLQRAKEDMVRVRASLRERRYEGNVERLRVIPRGLEQVEDALAMGSFNQARETLNRVQRALREFQ
ncbi:MAG: hypothetical protein ABH878_09875 [bacterium]